MSTTNDDHSEGGEARPRLPLESRIGGRDIDEAIDLYTRGYNGSGFHATKTDEPFAFRYTLMGDHDVTLRTSRFSASILGTVKPEGEYVVSWLTRGQGVFDVGADEVRLRVGQASMFPTGRRYAFRLQDFTQNLIHFDSDYLERIAAERAGASPTRLHFLHAVIPGDAALRRWRDTVAGVTGAILSRDSGALVRTEANAQVANALLETFAYEGPQKPRLLLPPSTGRLSMAVDFIHAHPDQPLTTTRIAQAAGLSLRGLQHAFSRQLEMTPTEYLRGVRLDRVRADLLAASAAEATVSSIAGRWGFSHSGRFSSAYVKRFGEYAAETLRR